MFQKGFKGNLLLRKAGVPPEGGYTPERIQEILKCAADPLYFFRTYVYIKNVDFEKKILFNPRDYQIEILNSIIKNRNTIGMLPRQVGKTLLLAGASLHYLLFQRNYSILIAAHKGDKARDIIGTIQEMYMELPSWLQQGIVEWNKGSFKLENGSRIRASTTSTSSARGDTYNAVLLDEFAHVPAHVAEDFLKSVIPTISSGKDTKIVITSCVVKGTRVFTPNGIEPIDNFINDDQVKSRSLGYTVPAYQIQGMKGLNKGNIIVNSGWSPTRKIICTHSEIECSLDHKLWAFSNEHQKYGWYRSEELKEGDYIAVQYGQNLWGNQDSLEDILIERSSRPWLEKNFVTFSLMTEDLAYFLGIYLAEGYSRQKDKCYQTTITCGDDITKKILFLGIPICKYDAVHYTLNSRSLISFLVQFGFDISKKAKEKTIPPRIMRMSKQYIAAFLRGFFDGDGTIHITKRTVATISASEELIDQIRMLLLNFGILSSKYVHNTPPTKKVKVWSRGYCLTITDENYHKFNEQIGFWLSRKRARIQPRKEQRRLGSPVDIIPDKKRILKERGIKWNTHFDGLSRAKALSLLGTEVEGIAQHNMIWSKIKIIEASEAEVYDFSLEHNDHDFWCHSIIYNGIVGHQTPKGLNTFHKVWESAIHGDVPPPNDFHPITISWNHVPGRDEKFKQAIIKQYGDQYFAQEYGCEFIGSSFTLISAAKLISMSSIDPIKYNDNTRIYEEPVKGKLYACTVDVAEGLGGDASVVMVFDITALPYYPVYIYHSRYIDTMALPGLIASVGKAYNDAMVLVESNFGQMVGDILWRDFEYEHVIFTQRAIKIPGGFKVGFGGKQQRPGVQMNPLTKRMGCATLKSLIENDQLIVRDAETIEELRRFAVKGKSYAAEQGNDDLAMALVLFAWLSEQGYLKHSNDANVRNHIAQLNKERIENQMLMAYHTDGSENNDMPIAAKKDDDRWLWRDDPQVEADPHIMDDLERWERHGW